MPAFTGADVSRLPGPGGGTLYATVTGVSGSPSTPVAEPLPAHGVPSYVHVFPVAVTVGSALVIVMLLLSLLPLWFASPPNVAVAVQPLADVTFVQSPL